MSVDLEQMEERCLQEVYLHPDPEFRTVRAVCGCRGGQGRSSEEVVKSGCWPFALILGLFWIAAIALVLRAFFGCSTAPRPDPESVSRWADLYERGYTTQFEDGEFRVTSPSGNSWTVGGEK